jgi:uncharacterized Fe-S cluster-containing radical SAM superfamily protein
MDCPFCFVPPELKKNNGKYFSAREIIKIRDEKEPRRMTIRLTGGEPFLAPEFISAMANDLENCPELFLWIDTNLMGNRYGDVVHSLYHHLHDRFGICGCFKGLDKETFEINAAIDGSNFENQWKNAIEIYTTMKDDLEMESIPLFFYVPEVRLMKATKCKARLGEMVSGFITTMQERIHENAPLRTTVLSINEYEANKGWMGRVKEKIPGLIEIERGITKCSWENEISERFPVDLSWLPQHQVPLS